MAAKDMPEDNVKTTLTQQIHQIQFPHAQPSNFEKDEVDSPFLSWIRNMKLVNHNIT